MEGVWGVGGRCGEEPNTDAVYVQVLLGQEQRLCDYIFCFVHVWTVLETFTFLHTKTHFFS